MSDVILRKWTYEDVEDLYLFSKKPEISKYMRDDFPSPYQRQDAMKFVSHVTMCGDNPTCYRAIVYKGKVVGSIALFTQHGLHQHSAQIGYWLCETFWNKGIMTQAIQQLCVIAFDQMYFKRVYAQIFEDNIASQHVLTKAGFSFELIKTRAIYKHSKYHNMLIYAKTR